jgi:ribosomal protein S18 acetylase RimI-like enzyme
VSTVSLRPAGPGDEEILHRVYASTRAGDFAGLPWSEAQLTALLRMQSGVQQRAWEAQYPRAERAVVLVDGAPAGRLYVDRSGGEIRLVDVALLPEHRGRGVGERLLRDLCAEADAAGRSIRLHVERRSPARRLYERLGFIETGGDEIRAAMQRSPSRPLQEVT